MWSMPQVTMILSNGPFLQRSSRPLLLVIALYSV